MTDKEFNRRMLRTVFTVAAVAILIAVLWEAREALMLIYVSALIAMGFAPLVQIIERRSGARARIPRWLAILVIYVTIVIVLHQIETALAMADRIIGLRHGRVAYDGLAGDFDRCAQSQVFEALPGN